MIAHQVSTPRVCGWCGVAIDHMRANAKYCCKQHGANAANKRLRERDPGYYSSSQRTQSRAVWREAHGEEIRAYRLRYRLEHPEAAGDWWKANRDKHRLYRAVRRSRKSGAYVVTDRDVARLLARFRNSCAYCGSASEPLHLDHVVPLARGGQHRIGNLLPACRTCNLSKNARLLADWKRRTRPVG